MAPVPGAVPTGRGRDGTARLAGGGGALATRPVTLWATGRGEPHGCGRPPEVRRGTERVSRTCAGPRPPASVPGPDAPRCPDVHRAGVGRHHHGGDRGWIDADRVLR